MSLLGLSNGLLLEIISYLKGSCTSISRCSRQLHEIAEPVLYSSVYLNHPKSYTMFIRTIVRNPSLAGYVRHFRTVGHPYGWDFDLSFLTLEDRAWIRKQLPDSIHGRSNCNKWFKKMFFSSDTNWLEVPIYWDAITTFLFTLFAAKLQTIRIDSFGWNVDRYRYIDMVLLSSVKFPGRFQHLEKVTLMACSSTDDITESSALPVHLIIPFLQVPSVAKFKASNLSLVLNPFKSAFHIRDLTLDGCRLTGRSLTSFLLCFHSLKRLKFYHVASDHAMLAASYVRRGFANSKDTLEEIVLIQAPGDVEGWSGDDSSTSDADSGFAASEDSDMEASMPNVLGSLQSFTKLKTLHIESTSLLPSETRRRPRQPNSESLCFFGERDEVPLANCFPASLEHLTLNISTGIHCYLSQMLSKAMLTSNAPNFKSVYLLFRHGYERNGEPMKPIVGGLEELRDLVRVEGVELSWDCMCELETSFQCYEGLMKG
ncbi:hypothetical protein DL98DRAFT_655997 [Cadophora sp. DSE1049]|nr:hypothetical protein DL98DRAFT_655997 [Cadophora sp. DSE1049]